MTSLRVRVVEDDARVRAAWQSLLMGTPGFSCDRVFASSEQALAEWPDEAVDVVLVDWFLSGATGASCIRELKRRMPHLSCLVVTFSHEAAVVFEALKAGADGYLLKTTPPAELLEAIREVRAGGAPMSPAVARKVLQHFHRLGGATASADPLASLSSREREVLERLTRGATNKEIAEELGVTTETIKAHLANIYAKLHVSGRVEAVAKYLQR